MLSTTTTAATTTKWSVELKGTGYITEEGLQSQLEEIFGPEGYKAEDFKIADRLLDVLSYLSFALRGSKAQDPSGRWVLTR